MSDNEDMSAEVYRRLAELDEAGVDSEMELRWDTPASLAVTCVVVANEVRDAVRAQMAAGAADSVAWLQAQERFKEILDGLPERVLCTLVIGLCAELNDADDEIAVAKEALRRAS